jgi:replicative DNA helicase
MSEQQIERGLPTNVDAERFVLGSILLDDTFYIQAAGTLEADDFSLEKHRTIFKRMGALSRRSEKIDRITVANELMKINALEACDGLTYLVSLDDGLPQIPNLDSYTRIVKDKATLRRIVFAGQHMMNRALVGEEEPEQILAGAEETLLKLGDSQVKPGSGLMTAAEILKGHEGGISAFLDPSKRKKGIATGFGKFDEYTCGLHGGDLVIIAARPSMGKTALLLNVVQHVGLKLKQPAVVFSLEMSKESLLSRLVCTVARVDSWRFRMGYVNAEERRRLNEALFEITEAPIYIDDQSQPKLMDMHARLRRLQTEQGKLGVVGVDYLQLMTGTGRQENRNQEVSGLSRGMKLLAKDLDVPMVVLSQLSRDVEKRQGDHRPQMSDLRESGSIEQDADLVGFIFREEVYKKDREDLKGLAELIIAKQRNGAVGTIKLVWLSSITKFENYAGETESAEEDKKF